MTSGRVFAWQSFKSSCASLTETTGVCRSGLSRLCKESALAWIPHVPGEYKRARKIDRHSSNMVLDLTTVSPSPVESNLVCGDGHNRTGGFADHIPEIIVIDSITLLICLCGLFGNGAILWLLGFCIKRNPFTVYFLNLAVADAFFLLCTSVFLIIYHVPMLSCFQPELVHVLLPFHSMVLLTYSASLYLLTAISVERCLGVLWPFWCRCHRPKLLSAVVCGLLWALACVLSGLVYFVCDLDHCKSCWVVLATLCFLNFFLFTPFMVLSNVILLIKLRRSSRQHHSGRLYTVVFLAVFFFLLFAIPLSAQIFLNFFVYVKFVWESCLLLASINSSSNPVIYVLVGSYRKSRFSGSVKVALEKVFEDKADPQMVGETLAEGIAA
ncbi:mas-related G-protein coupled receptor member H-like isoform X1 [Apteryx rowi]|uniref:mas-related G-protein coupled receptor member H-like isoform X1 n=1 Tax=Apteryx rowi TaxID=308060 RepID=UPI000E1DE81E|nr:mas-related G-protein coupled receptor member H-like isoform X1 [Apteryx rowi]